MDLQLYSLLSTIIVASTIVTIVFAVFSYLAFRYRRSKDLGSAAPATRQAEQPMFRKFTPDREV